MIEDVVDRLVGIVVMEGSIVLVVMLNVFIMLHCVRHACIASEQERSPLQSEALQGQAHQK